MLVSGWSAPWTLGYWSCRPDHRHPCFTVDSPLWSVAPDGRVIREGGSAMEPIKFTLTFERSSKRYHVYRDLTGSMVPDRLYILQADMPPGAPAETITVTVSIDAA